MKIGSLAALAEAAAAARAKAAGRAVVRVCRGGGCPGGAAVAEAIAKAAEETGVVVSVKASGCHGFCERGPIVTVEPGGILYASVKPADAPEIVARTVAKGEVVERLTMKDPATKQRHALASEVPFLAGQTRIALARAGKIDPSDLDDALALGAYGAAAKVLSGMAPEAVIDAIEASGLRGRGGAGFPTARKWRACRAATGAEKFVVANGTGILEIDPHAVLEGLLVAAFAVGARQGYLFVRADSTHAVKLAARAIEAARERGLLGEDVLGTGFTLDVRLALGGGEFVCGESTAVLRAIEGLVPEPSLKYVRSAERGLFGMPTIVDNAETLALVPAILDRGPAAFRAVGTTASPGTKVLNLTGKVKNPGLFEVPFGTTLRALIHDLGGGIAGKRKFKAAMVGGPSGGLLTERSLDLPLDYETLASAGAIVGSGTALVMDDYSCPVDIARYFTHSLAGESCGRCVPCREGLHRLAEILSRITGGKGRPGDLEDLRTLSRAVADASLCGLGKTAPNVVLTMLREFEFEVNAHVRDGKCPGGVCRELTTFVIQGELCEGCQSCRKACPSGAIQGEKKQPHRIDAELCTACGVCRAKCRFDAIVSV